MAYVLDLKITSLNLYHYFVYMGHCPHDFFHEMFIFKGKAYIKYLVSPNTWHDKIKLYRYFEESESASGPMLESEIAEFVVVNKSDVPIVQSKIIPISFGILTSICSLKRNEPLYRATDWCTYHIRIYPYAHEVEKRLTINIKFNPDTCKVEAVKVDGIEKLDKLLLANIILNPEKPLPGQMTNIIIPYEYYGKSVNDQIQVFINNKNVKNVSILLKDGTRGQISLTTKLASGLNCIAVKLGSESYQSACFKYVRI